MTFNKIEGLIAAPFTPMHADGSLNLEIIPAYYQLLKSNRVVGAFINGSTGEGVSQSMDEKKAVAEAWANVTREDKDFKVINLVGGTSLTDCAHMAAHTASIGLYAVSFTAPFYFKPGNAALLAECCSVVAEAAPDTAFYYYHIPVLTGVNVNMFDLLKAVDGKIPNFAGIKYTHEDFMDFLSCYNFANRKYDMLWGRDENLLPALAVGAKGGVGSTYNYAAPLYYNLIDAFNANNLEEANKLQQQSIDMIQLLGKYGGIATGKAFMKQVGLDCGGFRLPVKNMSEEQYKNFEEDVVNVGFHSFKSK